MVNVADRCTTEPGVVVVSVKCCSIDRPATGMSLVHRASVLPATQLSLLGSIRTLPGSTVSQLAEAKGFERTTLTRNLDKLEQMGLVISSAQGRGRIARITPRGSEVLRELLPLWRQAQAELRAELSAETFDDSISTLKRLSRV